MRLRRLISNLFCLCSLTLFTAAASFAGDSIETIVFTPKSAPIPELYGTSGLSAQGKIFYVGGELDFRLDGSCYAATHVYDPETDCWTRQSPLPECDTIWEANYGGARSSLWVLSGFTGDESALRSGWRFDPQADDWTKLAPFPNECGSARAFVVEHENDLFVFGGLDCAPIPQAGRSLSNAAWRYDTETGEWTPLAPMPSALATAQDGNGAAFVMGGEIWIVGGERFGLEGESEDGILVYDPKNDTWLESRQAPPSDYALFTARGGAIYGFERVPQRGQGSDDVRAWKYVPREDAWFDVDVEIDLGDFAGGDLYVEMDDLHVVNGKFYSRSYLGFDGFGQLMLEGRVEGSRDAKLSVSPGNTVIGTSQLLTAMCFVEVDDERDGRGGTPIEWKRFLVDGRDRTRGMTTQAIPGFVKDGGASLRFARLPKSLAERLGPGSHVIETEAIVGGVLYNRTVVWRCIETEEEE